jgi:hypothetical protein
MNDWVRRLLTASVAPAICVFAVAGCGSSSNNAGRLLQQTFTGHHTTSSGVLGVEVALDPSPSPTLKGPITFTFGGPFQTMGPGKLPQSDFNLGVGGPGFGGSIGILSTGSAGYVVLKGAGYQLPQASYARLESSFAGAAAPSGGGLISRLGSAVTNPVVVGQELIGGAETIHIRAKLNLPVVLADLSTILRRASSLGVSAAGGLRRGLSADVQRRLAAEIRNPTFDLWTGAHDKTLRRLEIGATVPISGQIAQLLGSMTVDLDLSVQYSQLNQPQTIAAPDTVRPYSELAPRLRALEQSLQGSIVSGQLPTGAATGSTGASTATSTAEPVLRYSECIEAAGKDVAKMQKCAPLLAGQ